MRKTRVTLAVAALAILGGGLTATTASAATAPASKYGSKYEAPLLSEAATLGSASWAAVPAASTLRVRRVR